MYGTQQTLTLKQDQAGLYTFLYADCFFKIPFCGSGISLGNGIADGAEIC